jgi:nucleoside-diphosphate-sugar epimerase
MVSIYVGRRFLFLPAVIEEIRKAGMSKQMPTGLLGASSFVGASLIPLLINDGREVLAFSRKEKAANQEFGVSWVVVGKTSSIRFKSPAIHDWLCVAPIWVLPEYFPLIESYGVSRVVALSSTSRFTKTNSSDGAEKAVATRLFDAEEQVKTWASSKSIEWVILRPTLIYGLGQDKNIAEIARFIRRFGFFPLLGDAMGLRQPIHVQDVAAACMAALNSPVAANRAYNISGGEILPYREIVNRVFAVQHRRPRLVTIPLVAFKLAIKMLRVLPRFRHWSAAMAERMNRDLVFDNCDAERDLRLTFRPLVIGPQDLPQ